MQTFESTAAIKKFRSLKWVVQWCKNKINKSQECPCFDAMQMFALVYSSGLFTGSQCPLPELRADRYLIWELCSWHDAVPQLIVPTLFYHPQWVRQGKQHGANLLCSCWTIGLGFTNPWQDSPLSMARAQPWTACVPSTDWVRDQKASCRSCCWTCLRLLCGGGAAVCCGGSPALSVYAFCGGRARKSLVLL